MIPDGRSILSVIPIFTLPPEALYNAITHASDGSNIVRNGELGMHRLAIPLAVLLSGCGDWDEVEQIPDPPTLPVQKIVVHSEMRPLAPQPAMKPRVVAVAPTRGPAPKPEPPDPRAELLAGYQA